MNNEMTVYTAYLYIQDFAQANQVDELRALELMVKYYKQLNPSERTALAVFMAKTREKA
jgi:uncharacterized protein YfkK (UPF0435 family)